MSCLRHRQGSLNCFQISHFADQHDVRILPKNTSQCSMVTFSVLMKLPLINYARPVLMREFDGIFYSYYVLSPSPY